MLSICIPVYNYSIIELVNSLTSQAIKIDKAIEILIIDDASNNSFREINRKISNERQITYIELNENIGRSKVRNLLADTSKYENLLFLDSNANAENKNFLKRYIENIDNTSVIIGGIKHADKKPAKEFLLRWTYGRKRESLHALERQKNPYNNFIAKNFLIPKKIFNKIRFDENIIGYGHEDTLFGLELKKLNIEIKHIENPLTHSHLEKNDIFLSKTEEGIINLKRLYEQKKNEPDFVNSIKLLRFHLCLGKMSKKIILSCFKLLKPILSLVLKSNRPNMIVFDFYKIGFLLSIE